MAGGSAEPGVKVIEDLGEGVVVGFGVSGVGVLGEVMEACGQDGGDGGGRVAV